jgi:predicted component of type VI protein secretion system
MRFLLERLAETQHFGPPSQFDLRLAVASQIQRLVSARVVETGNDINLLELGTANIVELGANNKTQLDRYINRLTRLITRYEPRLLKPQVQIQASGNPLQPYRLVVNGTLPTADEAEVFYFELPLH